MDRLFDGGMVSKQPTIVFAVYPNDRSNLHAKIPEELASKIVISEAHDSTLINLIMTSLFFKKGFNS